MVSPVPTPQPPPCMIPNRSIPRQGVANSDTHSQTKRVSVARCMFRQRGNETENPLQGQGVCSVLSLPRLFRFTGSTPRLRSRSNRCWRTRPQTKMQTLQKCLTTTPASGRRLSIRPTDQKVQLDMTDTLSFRSPPSPPSHALRRQQRYL